MWRNSTFSRDLENLGPFGPKAPSRGHRPSLKPCRGGHKRTICPHTKSNEIWSRAAKPSATTKTHHLRCGYGRVPSGSGPKAIRTVRPETPSRGPEQSSTVRPETLLSRDPEQSGTARPETPSRGIVRRLGLEDGVVFSGATDWVNTPQL